MVAQLTQIFKRGEAQGPTLRISRWLKQFTAISKTKAGLIIIIILLKCPITKKTNENN